MRDAWSRYLGVDVSEKFDHEEINQAVMKSPTLLVPESFVAELGDLVSYLVDAIQPHLGKTCPTVLTDWPQIMTSSTVQSSENNTIAVRSEIFVGGIELADGFPFLIEPQKQRQGFEGQQQSRNLSGKPIVQIDEQYLLALEHGLPDGAGMAMGFDRLVMLLLGQGNIRQVLPFAWDEL